MGLKTTVEAIAIKRANEVADLYIAKFNNLVNSTAQNNVGKITEVIGPNTFKVSINGNEQTVTYLGNRPISADGHVIIDGKFAQ